MHSVTAAAIFAVLFVPLGCWFVRQSKKHDVCVYHPDSLLCDFMPVRVTAYIMRAIMANSISEGSILNLFIADQVLFGVGFFALLYSAYTLVIDRTKMNRLTRRILWHQNRSEIPTSCLVGTPQPCDFTRKNLCDSDKVQRQERVMGYLPTPRQNFSLIRQDLRPRERVESVPCCDATCWVTPSLGLPPPPCRASTRPLNGDGRRKDGRFSPRGGSTRPSKAGTEPQDGRVPSVPPVTAVSTGVEERPGKHE
ncbi:hypothetical protein B0H12DRAFT_1218900 [Mycena haematopus]|nr:hypothetical protein B0H12DRAFT_1218900 [Mycena haematopus]